MKTKGTHTQTDRQTDRQTDKKEGRRPDTKGKTKGQADVDTKRKTAKHIPEPTERSNETRKHIIRESRKQEIYIIITLT